MATVYLAHDVRHHRHVALKVLNPELGAVLGAQRFLAEIRVTAKLQHPNLVPLFDSGDADGRLFYVMPYIAGESLRARLAREKQLPIEETVRLAAAVASALDYAHRNGVIHRDLKPENILLHEGQPLIADFGIALAISAAGGQRVTQTGLSLGTPQYMSPEQATGDRVIDQRTDVYSLGAVTYEMLTGDPPHSGSSAQAILARVVTEHPRPIRATRSTVPANVEAAVMRALEKLPADRWQTALEYAEALSGRARVTIPADVRTPGAPLAHATRTRKRFLVRPMSMVLAAGLAIGALVATVVIRQVSSSEDSASSLTFVVDLPVVDGARQAIGDFALSPDGRIVALVGESDSSSQLFLRRLSDATASPVHGTKDASFAAFSPNGRWVAVTTFGGRLLKVRVDRSAPAITLTEGVDWYSGVTWADDETIVLGSARPGRRGLGRVAATGGAVHPITTVTSPLSAHGLPHVASDGNTVFFTEWGPGFFEDDVLALGSLETGAFGSTSVRAYRPVGDVDGRVLYIAGTSLLAVPFDANRLQLTGDAVRVVEDVSLSDRRTAAISRSGTLAYARGQPSKRLLLLDRERRSQVISTDEHNMWSGGRFSPDGRRIAVDVWVPSGDTSTIDIWTLDVRARTFTRVTSLGNVVEPSWTSDGSALVFTTWFPRQAALWRQAANGAAPAEKILEVPDGTALFRATATPDGKGLIFCQGSRFAAADPKAELYYVAFDGSRIPERLTDDPMANACGGVVSPDGRWLAYTAIEARRPQVFVRPFRRPGGRVQISEGNGVMPVWSPDGRRVYYSHLVEGGRNWVVSAAVRTTGNTMEAVSRERITPLPPQARVFDVAPNDERILVAEPSSDRVQLVVTTNWVARLRERLAGRAGQ